MEFVQNVELHKNASFLTKKLGIFIESVSQNILCWSFTELNATQPSTDVFVLLQEGAMTLSIMTLSIMTLNITFKNVTINIKKLSKALKI